MRRQSRGTSRGTDRNRQCTQRRRANESRTEQNRTEGSGSRGQGTGLVVVVEHGRQAEPIGTKRSAIGREQKDGWLAQLERDEWTT